MTPVIVLGFILYLSTATSEERNLQENLIIPDVFILKTTLEGILAGAVTELAAISLPSLQQTNIAFGSASSVAFNWNSRKVYWTELNPRQGAGIKAVNLDGTDLENLVEVQSVLLAVDSITGNIYYQNLTSKDIIVYSRNGEKCSIIAKNQSGVSDIALHSSKSLLFWTNYAAVVRANMDGTNATIILKGNVYSITADEDSDRLYWIDYSQKSISSCDLNGSDQRVILNVTTNKLSSLAVLGGLVYFNSFAGKSIQSVSKHGGSPTVVLNTTSYVNRIALYGTNAELRENPCAGSPCSHLCVLKYETFACLCPDGQRLDLDHTTCI